MSSAIPNLFDNIGFAHPRTWFWFLLTTTAAIGGVMRYVTGRLKPPVAALQLAGTTLSAQDILDEWGPAGIARAKKNIWWDFAFVVAYSATLGYACFWAGSYIALSLPWLGYVGAVMGWSSVLAGLFDWIENIGLLKTIATGYRSKWVTTTLVCAKTKYSLVGITGLFLFFWGEFVAFVHIHKEIFRHPFLEIPALVVVMLAAGLIFLRHATTLSPSLLTLQLAPTPNRVGRVLNRWGPDGAKAARVATSADIIFALVYMEILAIVFSHIGSAFGRHGRAALASLANVTAVAMLLAAAGAVLANWATLQTLVVGQGGWWTRFGRFSAALRLALIVNATIVSCVFLLLLEVRAVTAAIAFITARRGLW